MRKTRSIDELRIEYQKLTGKEPAIRWNKPTLEKRITDIEILNAGYAAKNGAMKKQSEPGEANPEFEKLASDTVHVDGPEHAPAQVGPDVEKRGGYREGAGRPTGQTDSRARCERIMTLEVPDLAVGMGVDALNIGLARITGVGIDDKAVATEVLANMPHGSQSLALGLTRLLYYWCPSLEGRTDVVTLHLEALFLIFNPFRERVERMNQFIKQNQEIENARKQEQTTPAAPGPAAAAEPATKKSPAKNRSHAKRRR